MIMFLGTGTATHTGDGGAATSATMNNVESVYADTTGVVYISESRKA